jgi:hypothetical protein
MLWGFRRAWLLMTVGLACGPQVGLDDEDRPDSEGPTSSASNSSGPDSTSGPDATTGAGTISTSSTSTGPGNTFIEPPGDDIPWPECDLWTGMPCQRGEKCMPYTFGGGGWNATKCSPLAPDPVGRGQPCTVEDSPGSGIDDCEAFSMCWYVDLDTNEGTCVPFCTGNEAHPGCDDPCDQCTLTASGVLILCLPTCDPIAQDCPAGQGCYGSSNSFLCIAGAGDASPGEPCEYINHCEAGSFCASAGLVPGCRGGSGCCASFCDMTAIDPCPGAGPDVECVPWFEGGQTPPSCFELENVGACIASP